MRIRFNKGHTIPMGATIQFRAVVDTCPVVCHITLEAMTEITSGDEEFIDAGASFERNRRRIESLAETKIRSKKFDGNGEIWIYRKDVNP